MRKRERDAGLWPGRWWWIAAFAGPAVMLAPALLALWPA